MVSTQMNRSSSSPSEYQKFSSSTLLCYPDLYSNANRRIPVIGIFPVGILMIYDHAESQIPGGGSGPLQHLEIAIKITSRKNQSFADMLMNAWVFPPHHQ
jgi:hypothetical protein